MNTTNPPRRTAAVCAAILAHPERKYIPLRKGTKNPKCPWGDIGFDEARELALKSENIGWVLTPTDLVIDYDIKGDSPGLESMKLLYEGAPPQPTVLTPSGGGHLYYCLTEEQQKILITRGWDEQSRAFKKTINEYPGIDFLSKGDYVTTPPSSIGEKAYSYTEGFDHSLPSAPLPMGIFTRILEHGETQAVSKNGSDETKDEGSHTFIACPRRVVEHCLSKISPDLRCPEWRKVLACLRQWDPAEGYRLAKEWSGKSEKYSKEKDWARNFEIYWSGVNDYQVPFQTLFSISGVKALKHYSAATPPPTPFVSEEALRRILFGFRNQVLDEYLCLVIIKGIKGYKFQSGASILESFLQKHAEHKGDKGWGAWCREKWAELSSVSVYDFWRLKVESGYPQSVLRAVLDGTYFDLYLKKPLAPSSVKSDIYTSYALPGETFTPRQLPLVSSIAFDPGDDSDIVYESDKDKLGCANLFDKDEMTKPTKHEQWDEDTCLFLVAYLTLVSFFTGYHPFLYENKACVVPKDSALEQAKCLIGFIASLALTPHHRARWSPVIIGAQGLGKGLFGLGLCRMISNKYTSSLDVTTLTTDFNGYAKGMLFMVCDEFEINSSQAKDVLRRLRILVTDRQTQVTAKGKDPENSKIYTNFLFTGNSTDNLPISKEERRYALFNVPIMHFHISALLKRIPIELYRKFFTEPAFDPLLYVNKSRLYNEASFFEILGEGVEKYGGPLRHLFQNVILPKSYVIRERAPNTFSSQKHARDVTEVPNILDMLIEGKSIYADDDFCVLQLALEDLVRKGLCRMPEWSTRTRHKHMRDQGMTKVCKRTYQSRSCSIYMRVGLDAEGKQAVFEKIEAALKKRRGG